MGKQNIIEAAIQAIEKAYAPYSNHPVGAAILAEDGNIYSGCNVENAAYPLGQCAEATAIGNMVLGGARAIEQIVIVGPGEHVCTPCGGCRQKIREFSTTPDVRVTVCNKSGDILLETTISELLPHDFGPQNINK